MSRSSLAAAALICSAACYQPSARAQGSGKPITLYVTRRLNINAADGSWVKATTQGQYEVESSAAELSRIQDGQFVSIHLKYLGGKLLRGEGAGQGEKFSLADSSAGSSVYGYDSMLMGPQPDGTVLFNLRVGASFVPRKDDPRQQAAAEEALGCFYGWPSPKMSYAELRNLGRLDRTWTLAPFAPEFASDCGGSSVTIEIRTQGGIEAVPGGPYSATRGQPLTLDGSGSKGEGLTYQWTITPKGCPSGIGSIAPGHKEDARPSVVLLCNADISLTVSNGSGSDTKHTTAVVRARDWKTHFSLASEGRLPPEGSRVPLQSSANRQFLAGENRCALESYSTQSDHVLHPNRDDNGSWESRGYELEQVQDSGGPFDQWWFASEYKMKINRESFINPYILPGGPPPLTGAQRFYDANKALGTEVDGYIAAVRAHEGMANANGVLGHSGLIQQALPGNDPAPQIESKFRQAKDALVKAVDAEIRKAEIALCNATKDPLPEIWSNQLAFAADDTGIYHKVPYGVGGSTENDVSKCQ